MRSFTLVFALLTLAAPAIAQTMQGGATITLIRTGWNSDSFAVVTAEPILNPAGCSTPDGYISEKSLPGYSTYYAAALTAYLARRRVVITVHDSECFSQRPKLIGINLTNE
jgi:ABC-type proline/glycine betaine transport system substrate-binding protein